jgi:hypothetical protein
VLAGGLCLPIQPAAARHPAPQNQEVIQGGIVHLLVGALIEAAWAYRHHGLAAPRRVAGCGAGAAAGPAGGYWVIVLNQPYSAPGDVISWCKAQGLNDDDCDATLLSNHLPDGPRTYRGW